MKAYFRTVDTQIREWQDGGHNTPEDGDTDPNEGKEDKLVELISVAFIDTRRTFS